MFKGSFRKVSRVFQECFKGVSRKIKGHLKAVYNEVSRVQRNSKSVLGKF